MKGTWTTGNQPEYGRIYNSGDRLTNIPMVVSKIMFNLSKDMPF